MIVVVHLWEQVVKTYNSALPPVSCFLIRLNAKHIKIFAVYKLMDQATENCPQNAEPLVVLKADRKKPLVVVDAEHFFSLHEKR